MAPKRAVRPVMEPVDAPLLERRIAVDLAAFAERFLTVVEDYGPEAGESLLGAYAEWLGVDLADALVFLPADRGRELDALAERFLTAARQFLGDGSRDHLAAVAAVARECVARGCS